MRKLLLLIILFLVAGAAGCIKIDDEPVVNEDKVNEVISLIDLLPTEITNDNRVLVEQIRVSYDLLDTEEKSLVENYDILVNAETVIAAIDAAEEARIAEEAKRNEESLALLKSVAEEIEDNLPETIENHLELPIRIPHESEFVSVSWSSSDPFTLSNIGQLIPGYSEKAVKLTALLAINGVRYTFTKDVIVAPIEFDPLPKGKTVFAYSYGRAHGFDQKAIETIDVVNHAFASVVDGELNTGSLSDRPGLLSLRTQGVRVVLCIGGYANDAIPWSKAASTQEGRVKLAASIVEQVVKLNYDGVDVDWEYPGFYTDPNWPIRNPLDSENYTKMMKEIKTQLKAVNSDYIFSAAVPGGTWGPERYEIKLLTPIFDYFHLMTYDLDATDRTTHLTALFGSTNTINADCSVAGSVDIYTTKGDVDIKSKLVVGAAFYGRKFSNTAGIGKTANGRDSISYHTIKKDYLDKGFEEKWDSVAQAPYIHDVANNVVITYDNPASLKAKSKYVIDNGLAGMMFWQYGQDNTGTLVDAIHEGLKLGIFE